jgi:hypothetical protein
MATPSGNGGVERYWRSTSDRSRLALCRNGKMLEQPEPGGRWTSPPIGRATASRGPS